jgi:transposase InsO family protein
MYYGPEFTGRVLDQWAFERGVKLQFIEPAKPIQTVFIESFNTRLREGCLNKLVFISLDGARRKIETWREQYNRERPHSSLGYLTRAAFVTLTTSEPAARTHRLAQHHVSDGNSEDNKTWIFSAAQCLLHDRGGTSTSDGVVSARLD